MNSVPSQLYDGGLPRADEVSAMSAQSNEIVKGSRVTFKESAHVLQRIVEFMYLGEIADLEEGKSTSSEDDYNLWMWLPPGALMSACCQPRNLSLIHI